MEFVPEIGQGISQEETPLYVEKVAGIHIAAAERFLPEGDPLRDYILEYYSDTERLTSELAHVFRGRDEAAINEFIDARTRAFEDKSTFVEFFQRLKERTDTFKRGRERAEREPVASDKEYQIGAYREQLESQVVDAVVSLKVKGYETFQSGFVESDQRDQFIDMYNKDVVVPPSLIAMLEAKSFKISVLYQGARTTIRIHPLAEGPVRLDEWKQVWDEFAKEMPPASIEDLSASKTYLVHSEFRNRQDILREKNEA